MQKADGFRKAWGDRGMIGKSLLAAAVLALGLAAPKAHAVVIYDWSGTCGIGSNCTGQVTAVLTMAETYVPGDFADEDDFVSFSYSSSSGAYDILIDELLDITARLPAVSGEATLALSFRVAGFDEGSFAANGNRWATIFPPTGLNGTGDQGAWTLRQTNLSAPGSLSLLVLGLAGLALAGRRRGKAATGGGRCGAALPAGEDRP